MLFKKNYYAAVINNNSQAILTNCVFFDGSSWSNAYTDLQSALCNSCADTIRVAAGTYKPAKTNPDSTFEIHSPMALYGGYPATGNPSASAPENQEGFFI